MNGTNDSISPPMSSSAEENMYFMYIMVIIIFLGFAGHAIALIIFFKPPMKKRPVTAFHVNMSVIVLLLSLIGQTLSLVKSIKRYQTYELDSLMCRLSTGLELSGTVAYVLTSIIITGHSYFMSAYHVRSSSFYVPRRIKLTIIGVALSWITAVLLGNTTPWLFKDFVVYEDRVTCQLSWVGRDGLSFFWVHLVILWIYTPGLIGLIVYVLTRRLSPCPPDMPNALLFRRQMKSNELSNRLVLSLFVSILPYFTFGLFTAFVGSHFLPPFFMLVLETIAKSHVVLGPFVFAVKSRTYRAILGSILSSGPFVQVGPALNSDGTGSLDRSRPRGQALVRQQPTSVQSRRNAHAPGVASS